MTTEVLILPGYGNSDEEHWQSIWEVHNTNFMRVIQQDWESPLCSDWVDVLEQHILKTGPNVKIVAHSLGCLLLAHWAAQTKLTISGALLVAVPNPRGNNFPQKAKGFNLPATTKKLNFPSTMIASSDDPYSDLAFSKECSEMWGSKFIELGAYGHINSSSGLSDWPFGLKELVTLGS